MTHARGLPSPTRRGFLLLGVLLTVAIGACDARDAGNSLAVDTAEFILGGKGSEEHLVPSRIVVRSGGAVIFRTVDNRVHTIEFLPDSLAPELLDFLRSTGQLRSPPLLARGSVFRISLDGAPPGYYPFVAEGPGPPVNGAVFVE